MKKNLEFLKGKYFTHRGLHNKNIGIPENSMLAFKESLKKSIPIEFDIHLLLDGNIVVFHDDNLFRMTGYNKDIKTCTYSDIRQLKLLNTKEKIPLLKDVLELVNGEVLLDIELKYSQPAGKLEARVCEYLDDYKGQFVVSSFNPRSIWWFKKHRPSYIRGQLAYEIKVYKSLGIIQKFIYKNMVFNFISKPDFIAYRLHSLPNKRVEKYRERGYPILVWTIKTEDDLAKAKKYGDSFIYEKIDI